jgi:hypothetical protein
MHKLYIVPLAAACLSWSVAAMAAERPATKAEIEKIAVGHTVSGAMKYLPDGRYTYKGGSPGHYKISNGKICVTFDKGGSRCDRIVTDGKKMTLVNSGGNRFPFR